MGGTRRLDIAKKQHRERGQLGHRQKLGLLEKHKDYVQRARDYHSKQDRLKVLKGKAALRNKDEFYFGMIRGKTNKGVHVQSAPGTEPLPNDVVRLLKSQDIKYVQTMRSKEQKKIAKLQESLGVLAGNHLDEEEYQLLTQAPAHTSASRSSDAASSFSSSGAAAPSPSSSKHTFFTEDINDLKTDKPINAVRQKHQQEDSANSAAAGDRKGKGKAKLAPADEEHRSQLVDELRARLERDAALARVERDIQVQKLLMGKGAAKQIVRNKGQEQDGDVEGDDDDDDMGKDLQAKAKRKAALPKPQQGIRTGARVYKWKAERQK